MALKVKAKEQLIKIGKYADTYRHVMKPELHACRKYDGGYLCQFNRHKLTIGDLCHCNWQ